MQKVYALSALLLKIIILSNEVWIESYHYMILWNWNVQHYDISTALHNTKGSFKYITLLKQQNYTLKICKRILRLFKYPYVYSVFHTKYKTFLYKYLADT